MHPDQHKQDSNRENIRPMPNNREWASMVYHKINSATLKLCNSLYASTNLFPLSFAFVLTIQSTNKAILLASNVTAVLRVDRSSRVDTTFRILHRHMKRGPRSAFLVFLHDQKFAISCICFDPLQTLMAPMRSFMKNFDSLKMAEINNIPWYGEMIHTCPTMTNPTTVPHLRRRHQVASSLRASLIIMRLKSV